jgi:hypothetical protein
MQLQHSNSGSATKCSMLYRVCCIKAAQLLYSLLQALQQLRDAGVGLMAFVITF